MFHKISMWVVMLLILVGMVLALLFGTAVRHVASGGRSFGSWGTAAYEVAGFGTRVRAVFDGLRAADALRASEQRFAGEKGFRFNYPPGSRPDLGYLLLNRYDADRRESKVELWDLDSQQRVHEWRFGGVDAIWRGSRLSSASDFRVDARGARFRPIHALLLEDGRLVAANTSPIIEADGCSGLSLLDDSAIYHHSIERDQGGGFWAPIRVEPKTVPIGTPRFWEDGIALLSVSGKVLFRRSLVDILRDNGLGHVIYGRGPSNDDPTHLNDIEPVLSDGEFWQRGDVFLSLRHQSMVVLYRPSTDKIIWYQEGPWTHQHDVDILDDHRIAVFDNNATLSGVGTKVVRGTNRVLVRDFRTGGIQSPWQAGFEKLQIRTAEEGLADVSGTELMVEETINGRLVQFGPNGEVSWQFVNRAGDGLVYYVNWSRLVPRGTGDRALAAIRSTRCG